MSVGQLTDLNVHFIFDPVWTVTPDMRPHLLCMSVYGFEEMFCDRMPFHTPTLPNLKCTWFNNAMGLMVSFFRVSILLLPCYFAAMHLHEVDKYATSIYTLVAYYTN